MESLEQVSNPKNYKITSVNEVKKGNIKVISVISKNNKQGCLKFRVLKVIMAQKNISN